MSTLLHVSLKAQVEDEIRKYVEVRPHVKTVQLPVILDASHIALTLISARAIPQCDAFFAEWQKQGLTEMNPDDRVRLSRGMLENARKDVIVWIAEHTSYTADDLKTMDVAEATALQVVVLILGNMLMHSLHLQHGRAQAENPTLKH